MGTSPWRRDLLAGVTAGVASAALLGGSLWFAVAPFDTAGVACSPPVAGADPPAGHEGEDPCDAQGDRRLAIAAGLFLGVLVPLGAVARLRTEVVPAGPPRHAPGPPGMP